MFHFNLKFRIIFLPYLIISVSVISLFSFIKWYFEVKHRYLLLHSSLFDAFVSAIIVAVLTITILRKRLHILDVRKNDNIDYTFYYMLIVFSIVVPLNFALNYIGTQGYQLVHVRSADEIVHLPHTRYYAIDNPGIRLSEGEETVNFDHYTSGKHNRTLNFSCHAIFPVQPVKDSAVRGMVWLCMYFHESMSNSDSDEEKSAVYSHFTASCNEKIKWAASDIWQAVYYDNIPDGNLREHFSNMQNNYTYSNNIDREDIVILKAVYSPFSERSGNNLPAFIISWILGLLIMLVAFSIPLLHHEQYEEYKQGTLKDRDDLQRIVEYLHSHRYNPFALLLMLTIITILVLFVIKFC